MFNLCLILYFCVLSVWDINKKELPGKMLVGGVIAAFIYGIWNDRGAGLLLGCIPGVLLLLMGFLTKEKVGYGDGIMVLVLGLWLKWPESVLVYFIAQFGVLFWAVALLWLKKAPRELKIPFAPFLTAALFIFKIGGLLI